MLGPTVPLEELGMCLTCGCMDAHKEMGQNNITYEDVRRAAEENGTSVDATLRTMKDTADLDRSSHQAEYTDTLTGTHA